MRESSPSPEGTTQGSEERERSREAEKQTNIAKEIIVSLNEEMTSMFRQSWLEENQNLRNLAKSLNEVAEEFPDLELTSAQKELLAQTVKELHWRVRFDRHVSQINKNPDPDIRQNDLNLPSALRLGVLQIYTFLKTIENGNKISGRR